MGGGRGYRLQYLFPLIPSTFVDLIPFFVGDIGQAI